MKQNRNIVIGINWEQNSTAALMVDNQIVVVLVRKDLQISRMMKDIQSMP